MQNEINGTTQLDRAEQIARLAHRFQKDKAGQPYFGHVQRVADAVPSTLEKVVAFLHDVLEDNPRWTAFDLAHYGIEPAAIDAVLILTKLPNEPYPTYIERVKSSKNPLAIAVKKADIDDHLTNGRCPENLVGRYRSAEAALRDA
jgi:(p)ppGpp synthase/HD superfamily hydrolase